MAQEPLKQASPRNTVGICPTAVAPGGLELLQDAGVIGLVRQQFHRTRRAAVTIGPLRKDARHQTARAACSATVGHSRMPASLTPAPAFARTATAATLYSSIAAINPRPARLAPSSRASQQATPRREQAQRRSCGPRSTRPAHRAMPRAIAGRPAAAMTAASHQSPSRRPQSQSAAF